MRALVEHRVSAGLRARAAPGFCSASVPERVYARVKHAAACFHCHICRETADSVLLSREKAGVVESYGGSRGGGEEPLLRDPGSALR